MKLQRVLERISGLASRGMAPRGIIEEGRIFAFGVLENEDHLHGRATDVIEGLKDHVGQPFDLHPWAFVYEISTHKQDGNKTPIPVVGLVFPQAGGSVVVKDYLATPKGLRFTNQFVFHHTANGTTVTVQNRDGDSEDRVAGSLYPPAIAMLNTRGCSIDLKRAPTIVNAKRARKGKNVIPGHYNVDAREYFAALGSTSKPSNKGGTHASPIPHLRRAHERVLASGKRIWIPSALVNVRSEGDVAFVERRKSYKRSS